MSIPFCCGFRTAQYKQKPLLWSRGGPPLCSVGRVPQEWKPESTRISWCKPRRRAAGGGGPGNGADLLLGRTGPRGAARPAEHTPPGRTNVFRTLPTSWLYLRADGELPKQLAGIDPGSPLWIVRQNRPGRRSSSKAALPSPSPSWGFRSCGFSPIPEVARLGVEQQPVIGRTSFQKAKK